MIRIIIGALLCSSAIASTFDEQDDSTRLRRSDDEPFRLCGTVLIQHIMVHNLCDANRCKHKRSIEISGARARRGGFVETMMRMCCHNKCRPSEIQATCCKEYRLREEEEKE